MSNEQILRFSRQIARALSHVHHKGVLHRDVSPNNVWLDERHEAHLGDFDSAVLASSAEIVPPLTSDAFASPEERRGGHLDQRSDLFSLGRVMAFLMTADMQAVGDQVDTRTARPDLPPVLHEVVTRLIAESPDDRPVDADTVLDELNEVRRWKDVRSIIEQGEGECVEFKSSLCYPYKVPPELAGDWNKALQILRPHLEKEVLKSIAAFLNSNGGTLLIGVDDAGKILGIERDFEILGPKGGADAWQQHFRNCVLKGLGADVWSNMRLSIEPGEGISVARAECNPRRSPTWLKMPSDKQHELYVRSGSATDQLSGPYLLQYLLDTGRAGTR
jgi:hypothetical protein